MTQTDLAQHQPAHRHRQRLCASVARLACDYWQQHRKCAVFGDRAFEQPDDRCGKKSSKKIDL